MTQTQAPIGEFTGCLSKILGLGEPGTWTARLRRWVVLYKSKRWKHWRVDDGSDTVGAPRLWTPRKRYRLKFPWLHFTRKQARIVAQKYRDMGFQARVRKAFIEIPLEP